jgi:hypothetical protein
MKKTFYIAAFLFLISSLYADTTIEGKFSYFRPNSHILRQIFPGWMPVYQVEARTSIAKYFDFWGSMAYISKHGHSLGGHQRTTIHIVPFTTGIDLVSRFSSRFKLYAGAGARYFFVNVINHSQYVHRTDTNNGIGGAFRAGSLINLSKHFVLDLCADYSLKEMDFSGSSSKIRRHDLDLSGISLGVGLGYQW